MKTRKFDKILHDIDHFFEWGHYDSSIPLWTCIIILTSIMLYGYYNKPELEEYNLKEKLPTMSEEEQLRLLATDGMLVKRPLLIGEDFVMTGFREAQWQEVLRKGSFL